jgi:thiol-disulfide isomerase/thioredoxin
VHYSHNNTDDLLNNNKKGLILFYDRNLSNADSLEKILKNLNIRERDDIIVALSEIHSVEEVLLAELVGVSKNDLPAVFLTNFADNMKKYKMKGEITKENIINFVGDFDKNRLEPFLKYEYVQQQSGKLINLNSISFPDFYNSQRKSSQLSFVLFYTSKSCILSQQAEKVFDSLAEKFSLNNLVSFAKFDASKNEVSEIKIEGFPTLLLFSTDIKEYYGERKIDEMAKFINQVLSDKQKTEL